MMIELSNELYLYLTVLFFFWGACIGSFLNVCIYRIPRDESVVKPRSHCPHCGKMIAWYHNLPLISYLALKGRCAYCSAKITSRYFWVELLTAVLFLLIWDKYGIDPRTPVYWLMISGLILGTFVDFEHMIIPDRVSIGGMYAGVALSLLFPVMHHTDSFIWSGLWSVVGMVAGAGSLWSVGVIGKWALKKDAMGFGDVKLLGAIGAFLGWQAVIFTIVFSSLIGSVVGVGFIAAGKREWQSRIPYGPYLAVAAVVWILWGSGWWQMYIDWLTMGMQGL